MTFENGKLTFLEVDCPEGPLLLNISDIITISPSPEIGVSAVVLRGGIALRIPKPPRILIAALQELANNPFATD